MSSDTTAGAATIVPLPVPTNASGPAPPLSVDGEAPLSFLDVPSTREDDTAGVARSSRNPADSRDETVAAFPSLLGGRAGGRAQP